MFGGSKRCSIPRKIKCINSSNWSQFYKWSVMKCPMRVQIPGVSFFRMFSLGLIGGVAAIAPMDGWKLKTNPIWNNRTRHHHRTPWFLRKDDAITERDVTNGRDHMYGIARPYAFSSTFGWIGWTAMNLFWQIHQALGFWHIMTLFESLTLLIYCRWQRVFNIIFNIMSSINDFMTGEASTLTSSPGTWDITKHHHGNPRVSGPCFAGWSMEPYNPVSWWMRRVSQGSLNGSHFVRGTNFIVDGAGHFLRNFRWWNTENYLRNNSSGDIGMNI